MSPDVPKKPGGLFNETVDAVFANLLASILWAVIILGPVVIRFLWKRSGRSGLKPRIYLTGTILFGATWLAATVGLMGYGAYRNLPSFTDFANRLIPIILPIAPGIRRLFNSPIFPAPTLLHLCLIVVGWAGIWSLLKLWRRRFTGPTIAPSLPSQELKPDNTSGGVDNVAPIQPPAPAPRQQGDIPACRAFNLPWRKEGDTWNPVCPLCGSSMGLLDIQQEGMYVHDGGRPQTGCVAECANLACKNRAHVARRKETARQMVQQKYEQKRNC